MIDLLNLYPQIFTLPNVIGTIVFMSALIYCSHENDILIIFPIVVKVNPSTKVGLLLAFYCTQGFGAVATLNLSVMSGNVGGRSKQVVASTLVFVYAIPLFRRHILC